MGAAVRRAVLVHRSTEYELLLARHATRAQARFFLTARGLDIDEVEAEHEAVHAALARVAAAIPPRWRRSRSSRDDLDRFLFEPDDIVIAVGQDGLVANLAKYLDGQPVIGVNPLPQRFDGVLARFSPASADEVLAMIERGREIPIESRTMVEARLDDTQRIRALNEIFIGHQTHQSARYRIRWQDFEERQSSSGIIASTGTGATGWARSINESRGSLLELPGPLDPRIAFFVREAFPSVATGTSLTLGVCQAAAPLTIVSEMNRGGVIFGDGIEDDFLQFGWGQSLTIAPAGTAFNLVVA